MSSMKQLSMRCGVTEVENWIEPFEFLGYDRSTRLFCSLYIW